MLFDYEPMNFAHINIPLDHVIYKSSLSYCFVNIKPFLQFHLLVSPIRIVERLNDLTENEGVDIFSTIRKIIEKLDILGEAWTISLQDGCFAGQTIPHLHFHLIPRRKDDLKNNNDIYGNLSMDCNRKERTYNEMKEEANYLKGLIEKDI